MTIKKLIDELTKREGKKKSISRAQVAEVVGHLSDILANEGRIPNTYGALILNGIKRAIKRKALFKKGKRK